MTDPITARTPLVCSDERHTAKVTALEAEREQLLAELDGRGEEARERWIKKQLDQTRLKAADFRNGMAMEIEPAREIIAHWAGAARAMLGDAPNYTETPVEMEVKVGESPERYAFVLQRVGRLSPHQARQQAEAERDRYAALLREYVQLATITHRYGALGGHDNLGEDFTCSGCALLNRIRTALDEPAPATEATDTVNTKEPQ